MCRQQLSDLRYISAIKMLLRNSLVFHHNCCINLLLAHECRCHLDISVSRSGCSCNLVDCVLHSYRWHVYSVCVLSFESEHPDAANLKSHFSLLEVKVKDSVLPSFRKSAKCSSFSACSHLLVPSPKVSKYYLWAQNGLSPYRVTEPWFLSLTPTQL